jgi:hypothetical protein
MGFYSGNSGSIQFGDAASVKTDVNPEKGWTTSPTKITNWTLSTSAQLLDTTTLGDYDKSSVYGLRTTSGTLKLFYYISPSTFQSYSKYNSASWFTHALARSQNASSEESLEVRLRLYIDDKNMQGKLEHREYVELDANLTSVSYGSNVGELVSVDVSFEANGPIIRDRL